MNTENELDNYRGAYPDSRSAEKKKLDYPHDEILGGSVSGIVWEPKESWAILDLRKQITSSSCGGQAGAKGQTAFSPTLEVMSATPIYHFRSNFPDPGMFMQDIGDIMKNRHTATENSCPSQNMTEDKMNAAQIPEVLPFGISGYYFMPSLTEENADLVMDLIATGLEKEHTMMFLINSNIEEWIDVPLYSGHTHTFSHYVSSVPKNYLLHDGEKSVVIDDSCNEYSSLLKDGKRTGQRILTVSFLKARCYGIMGLIPSPSNPSDSMNTTMPHHVFDTTKTYEYVPGMIQVYNDEVLQMQKCLAYLGILKDIFCVGYYGPKTKEAVINFQNAYKDFILIPAGLTKSDGIVSYHTLSYLNSKFGQS